MPIIEVKAFDHRFEDDEKAALVIQKLTAAFGEVYGEAAQKETEVVLQGVSPRHWGFGGERRV
jgi:phenylpyruvate tautomerase PptA (4-oxalocrotonate tautomerase family)